MKTFLNRFVAMVLLLLLSVMLCFQNAAMAGPRSDDGDGRAVASHQRQEGSPGLGGPGAAHPGWRLPDIFWRPKQGRPPIPQVDKIAREALKDRDRPTGGAGGRDAGQRERNQESGHKGHGGPQDP